MKASKMLCHVLKRIQSVVGTFADDRQGPNLRYTLADAVLSAFACFFLQSPSFLAFQRRMQGKKSPVRTARRCLACKAFPLTRRSATFWIASFQIRFRPCFCTFWIRFVPRGTFRRLYDLGHRILVALR